MGRIIIATEAAARPTGNTTQYGTNEMWASSASAPTAYVFGELAGLSGTIVDAWIASSNDPATLLQAEIWLFDDSTALVNDNAAFALSDEDVVKGIAHIPFTLVSSVAGTGTNSVAHVIGVDAAFDCTNKAGLYMLIKVKNAYTPADGETLTVRLKVRREAG